jgi:hypothetical protein
MVWVSGKVSLERILVLLWLTQPAALYAFINKVIDFSYGCDILFIFRPRVASRQMPDNTTHLGRLVWALDLEGIRKPS